ncbi:MAG: sigma-E processing peptidase SpoIIGA, partial [Oscillospiraceae bacterium]|nr:sigma-E processing peptidase SpoIIGA [Oscillospiraceae bacterium]
MGMTVYADALFALNAAIDYLILAASAYLGGGEMRWKRLLMAACLGGLYAAASLLPQLGFLQSPVLYAVSLSLMLMIAFGWQKRTLRLGVLFLALSFAFGGAVTVCARLFGTGLVLIGTQVYYPVSFLGVLTVAAVLYLVCRMVFTALAE